MTAKEGAKEESVTLVSWAKSIAERAYGPLWERFVVTRADEQAVRRKILESMIRFRLSDFSHKCALDPDRAEGIAVKLINRLRCKADDKEISITSFDILKIIENEIQVEAVPTTIWVQLACLYEYGEFNPRQYLVVEFTQDNGTQFHGSTVIASMQPNFPFLHRMIEIPAGNSERARLSQEASQLLRCYCSTHTIMRTRYTCMDSLPVSGVMVWSNPNILKENWKPQ